MKTRAALIVTLLMAVAVALVGCSGDEPSAGTGASIEAFLDKHDLGGKSAEQIIETLDKSNDDRATGLVGSVRYDELQLTDGADTYSLPIDSGDFYLAIAPYASKTHECFYHNLATCQGELVSKELDVTITAADGTVLVDDRFTTYDNGFAGFWLPRDITGTIVVSYDGKSVTAPFSTDEAAPTCVTTLKLVA